MRARPTFNPRAPRLFALATALALFSAPSPSRAAGPDRAPSSAFPLAITVAHDPDGAPVVPDAWLAVQLSGANELFGPLGVTFVERARTPLDASLAHVETREDRDGLAAKLAPAAINVFVVASLRDVDEANRYRMGVHWRLRRHPTRRYVILSATAGAFVLAHELGHFFGNAHSSVTNNVMSYARDGGLVFFDATQAARIRAEAALLARLFAAPGRS